MQVDSVGILVGQCGQAGTAPRLPLRSDCPEAAQPCVLAWFHSDRGGRDAWDAVRAEVGGGQQHSDPDRDGRDGRTAQRSQPSGGTRR